MLKKARRYRAYLKHPRLKQLGVLAETVKERSMRSMKVILYDWLKVIVESILPSGGIALWQST